jgi:hypothetical protein
MYCWGFHLLAALEVAEYVRDGVRKSSSYYCPTFALGYFP